MNKKKYKNEALSSSTYFLISSLNFLISALRISESAWRHDFASRNIWSCATQPSLLKEEHKRRDIQFVLYGWTLCRISHLWDTHLAKCSTDRESGCHFDIIVGLLGANGISSPAPKPQGKQVKSKSTWNLWQIRACMHVLEEHFCLADIPGRFWLGLHCVS